VRNPLLEAQEHLIEERVLLSELGRELVHVGVRRLTFKPQLGVRADDVLDAVGEEEHEHKVLELAVHRDCLVLLRRA
jgi:hypothetical protein